MTRTRMAAIAAIALGLAAIALGVAFSPVQGPQQSLGRRPSDHVVIDLAAVPPAAQPAAAVNPASSAPSSPSGGGDHGHGGSGGTTTTTTGPPGRPPVCPLDSVRGAAQPVTSTAGIDLPCTVPVVPSLVVAQRSITTSVLAAVDRRVAGVVGVIGSATAATAGLARAVLGLPGALIR